MQYRKFGRIGWDVSVLGFGAMRLPTIEENGLQKINEAESIEMIRYAIDHGVNYIDTAWYYHKEQSEALVGKALQDGYRKKVKLVSKLPIQILKTAADFDKYLDLQLQKLQTEYLDLYLFHALNEQQFKRLKEMDLIPKMENAKISGKIKHFGFSFHDSYEKFKEIIDFYDWEMCQIQFNYLDYETQATIRGLKYAASKNMAVVVMEPIKGGLLVKDSSEIYELLQSAPTQRTLPDWALQYVWNHAGVSLALSGMSNLQMVKENIASAEKSEIGLLSKEELAFLDVLGRRIKEKSLIPCTFCEYCLPCPANVSIPHNFRVVNNAFWDNDFDKGKKKYFQFAQSPQTLEESNNLGSAALCIDCGECLDKCPQHINIPWVLKKVREAFENQQDLVSVFPKHIRGPVFQSIESFTVVGAESLGEMDGGKIKDAWDRFQAKSREIENAVQWIAYGVQYFDGHGFHYIAGGKVTKLGKIPENFVSCHIEAHEYARFTHVGPASTLGDSYNYIKEEFFPNHPKLTIAPKHVWYEYYDQRFKPDAEDSELDIFVPILPV